MNTQSMSEPQRTNLVSFFNHLGFIRCRSDGSGLRPFHVEVKQQPADLERNALIKQRDALVDAQRRLRTIRIAVAGLDVSDYVFDWLDQEIRAVRGAHTAIRRAMHCTLDRLDMATEAE